MRQGQKGLSGTMRGMLPHIFYGECFGDKVVSEPVWLLFFLDQEK